MGRLWKAKRIITFWDYPTEKHLHTILLDVEEKTGVKPSEWMIEVADELQIQELGAWGNYAEDDRVFVTMNDYKIGMDDRIKV